MIRYLYHNNQLLTSELLPQTAFLACLGTERGSAFVRHHKQISCYDNGPDSKRCIRRLVTARQEAYPAGVFSMATLAMAVLAGAALGLRFRFLVLLPTTGFALAAIIVGGVVLRGGLTHIVLVAVLAIAGLQVGFLAGFVIRYLIGMLPCRRAHRPT